MVQPSLRAQPRVALPTKPVECTLLTPSGVVIGRGRAAPRAADHLAEAYSVRLTAVEPAGALEALMHVGQPDVVLRWERAPEVPLRIDHITGAPAQRAYYCHLR